MILCFAIFTAQSFTVCASENIVLHVSSDGNDSWQGTEDAPLKTPEGARKKARGIKRGNGEIHIIFHEGDYEFAKPLEFNVGDAGTSWAKVYYEAAEGEDVNFTGSKKIDVSEYSYVTDKAVLDRLPESSRESVIQIDLKKSGITELEQVDFTKKPGEVCSDIALFLNNKEQMIAQWPNGRWNFTTYGTIADPNGTLQAKEPEIQRWVNAKDWYIYGFFAQDYNFDKVKGTSVNPENNTFTVAENKGFSDTATKRYQAFNLLEELDTAMEWYIDRDNLILYYFPPKKLESTDKLELSIYKEPLIRLNSYDNKNRDSMNIVFKGINFSKTVGDVFDINTDCVTVSDCIFEFIGGVGIENEGGNVFIENNVFSHVNNYVMRSTDYYSDKNVKDDPIRFKNNYLYLCSSYVSQACQSIASEDQNFTAEHNTFHYSQGAAMAAGWTSRDNKFMYNECYNLMKERADIGMAYNGKSRYYHDYECAYNYFYDYNQKTDYFEAGGQGIYMDDCYAGAYVHHNILYNGGGGIQIGGGQNNVVENNIIVDMVNTPLLTDNRGEVWNSDWFSLFYPQASDSLQYSRIVKRNPGIWDTVNNNIRPPLNNVLADNVSNRSFTYNSRFKELGTVKNNITVKDKDSFVNPEKGDYRIKSDSKLAKALSDPWTEKDYDLYSVGAETEIGERLFKRNGNFKLLYPFDGQSEINVKKAELHWEQADTADKYTVKIAADPEMKNIVETLEVSYNYAEPKKLEIGEKTYYWTVTAENTGFKTAKKWETSSGVYSFTTSKYDKIDYAMLEYKIKDAQNLRSIMTEDTYEKEAISIVDTAVSNAKAVLNMPYGTATQEGYEAALNGLSEAVDYANKHKIYHYVALEDEIFSDKDKWILPEGVTAEVGDGMAFSSQTAQSFAVKDDKKVNELYNFKAKIDFDDSIANKESLFATFDLFRENVGGMAWTDTGYMVIVKQHKIELQKYKNGGGGIIDTVSTDIASDEDWHEYSYGIIEEPDCYRVVFRIDGTTIFDRADYNKNLSNGYMAFGMVNTKLALNKSEAEITSMDETVYKISGKEYSDTGSWKDGENTRISTALNDTAVWEITPGAGQKELYFAVPEGADLSGCEITVTYDYIKTREGEEVTRSYTVDAEKIRDGWYYLCTDDAQNGTITVTVTNINGKTLEISAIKTVNAG